MSERITRQNVEDRVANLNRRLASRGSKYRWVAEGRNGSVSIDRVAQGDKRGTTPTSEFYSSKLREEGTWFCQNTVTTGTKRQVADFLYAAMVALDDAGMPA